ncbi:MAG: YwaF family protein [Clostridia bacterium]|nr:YwaF family protein [Clostridia bacterium]
MLDYIYVTVIGLLLILITVPLVLVFLRGKRELAEKIVFAVCCFVLIYKLIHFTMYCTIYNKRIIEQLPVEISSISYFLFPIAYLTGIKWLKDSSRFIAFMAGFIQLVAISVSPQSFVLSEMPYFTFVESIILHYALFLGSFICITCIEPLNIKQLPLTLAIFTVVVLWGGVLAAQTWQTGSNIMFVQENVIPPFLLIPGLGKGKLYIIEYVMIFLVYCVAVYGVSYACHKGKTSKASAWNMGPIRNYIAYLQSLAPVDTVTSTESQQEDITTQL